MEFMELREFKEKQIEKAYDQALKKQLNKFLDIEDQALDLLADSMLVYSTATQEEMDDYTAKLKEFDGKLKEVDEVHKIIHRLERYESQFYDQFRNSFEHHSYGYLVSEYCDELDELRKKRNENT